MTKPRLSLYRSLAKSHSSQHLAGQTARAAHEADGELVYTPVSHGGLWLVLAETRFGQSQGYVR